MSSSAVAKTMQKGLKRVFPNAEYCLVPMADGGEGTTAALVSATNGHYVKVQVHNPLNQMVSARYGFLGDGKTAVIEMAEASGIQYVDEQTKNPLTATTYGTGEMIIDAIKHGAQKIILGIGGSATIDGGSGMVQALGAKLLDQAGNEIGLGGGSLAALVKIDLSNVPESIKKVQILIASDVTNPLTGANGAAQVFGSQKGATKETIPVLGANLHHFSQVVKRDLKVDYENTPGSGAAGGLGFGLLVFTNAKMQKGVDLVIKYADLKAKAKNADFVFTGEGATDFQTKFGKTPYGVAKAVKEVNPKACVYLLSGSLGEGADELYQEGLVDAIFSTVVGAKSLNQALNDAPVDIALTAESVARVIARFR